MRALVVVLYLLNVSYALCAFYMYIYTEHLLGVVAGADRDSGETDTSYLICWLCTMNPADQTKTLDVNFFRSGVVVSE